MRIHDLYRDLFENAISVGALVDGLPPSFPHSMPESGVTKFSGLIQLSEAMTHETI
jgi:hypothetical protein